MKQRIALFSPAGAMITLLLAGGCYAQDVIRCSSDDGGRHHCDADTSRGVRMVRQASESPCREGSTWGWDRQGIWVDRGCRADFQVQAGSSRESSSAGAGTTLRCSSDDGNRHYCSVDTSGGVRMVHQASESPCRQGSTWGWDRQGIWVDRGCRADFEVGTSRGSRSRWPWARGGQSGGNASVLQCSSDDGHRHYCQADIRGSVRMLRQRSESPCKEGSTWGWDRRGVWVDRGCRAEFEIRSR